MIQSADENALVEKKELAEQQERLRFALNAAEMSTWDWDIPADNIVWSENLEPQLALPANSFRGTYAAFLEFVHPEDRDRVAEAVNNALYHGATYHIEFRMVRADGSVRSTETRGKVYRDESGKPVRMSGVDLDITERKDAEEQLRRSEAEARARATELQAILDAVPCMTFIAHDPACTRMTSSKAAYEMLRLRPGANSSKSAPEGERPVNFWALKDGQEIPSEDLPVQKAASTGQHIRHAELTLAFDDGTAIDILGNAVPLLDADGKIRGAVGSFIDITDLKHTEEELRETQRELHDAQRLAKSGSWKWYPKTDSVTWTEGVSRIFGRDPKLPAPRFVEQRSLFTPESWQRLNAALEKTFKTGEEYELELDVIRSDGAIVNVVTHAEAERDASGEVVKLYGSVQDVTEWKQVEEQLRASEERLRFVADRANAGVWHWDLVADTLEWSPLCKQHFGIPLDEKMSYARFLDAVHPDDREETDLANRGYLEKGGPGYEKEYRVVLPDGTIRWIHAKGSATFENGRPIRMAGIVLDVTERKQTEEALRKTQEFSTNVLASIADGFMTLDREWRITYVNPKGAEIVRPLGKTAAGLLGKVLWEEFTDQLGTQLETNYRRTMDEKIPTVFENFYAPLQTWFELRTYPSPDGMSLYYLDITERKRAEAALRESEERYRLVMDTMLHGMVHQDADGRIISMNAAAERILGRSLKQIQGIGSTDEGWRAIREDGSAFPGIEHPSMVALQTGKPIPAVVMGVFNSRVHAYRWINVAAVPLFREGERAPYQVYTVFADITERKTAEDALRRSHFDLEQKVEERTRALSASLTALESEVEVRKQAETALQDLSVRLLHLQDEERRRMARDLHDSTGQTLTALKMTVSSLASLVSDNIQASKLTEELSAFADEALKDIRTISHLLHPPLLDEVGLTSAARWYVEELAKRSGIKANVQLASVTALSKQTELVLFRVLQESLTNVVRHSDSKNVDISLHSNSENAILIIKDYGKGIPAEKLKNFNETGAGVGVGLGGMKQRLRERGGYFRVSSDGTGTCITAIVPISQSRKESPPA